MMRMQIMADFFKTKQPSSGQLNDMKTIVPQINTEHHLMEQVSREVDGSHLDMLIAMGLDVVKFTRFILKNNRDDLFDHLIGNQNFLFGLSHNLTYCSPYALDKSLALGIVPNVRDIYFAAKAGDADKVQKLIMYGGDINGTPALEDVFDCVLRGPVLYGHTDLALKLLGQGAKATPECLYDAIRMKNHTLFVALLDSDIKFTNKVAAQIKNLSRNTSPEIEDEIERRGLDMIEAH